MSALVPSPSEASYLGKGIDLDSSNASFLGGRMDRSGYTLAGVGDVNGDGFDDFVTCSEVKKDVSYLAGHAVLILGRASGWALGTPISEADASFRLEFASGTTALSVAGAGDVNGDGYDDILFGYDLWLSNRGKTYLVLGKASGWAINTSLASADASFIGEGVNDLSGFSVAGVGDVNGDGYDDIAVGARNGYSGGGVTGGKVYLILGKPSGWGANVQLSAADASFVGEGDGDGAGWSVAGAGDVNGDGLDDLLIGAPYNGDGGEGAGKTYLVLGKASGWALDTPLYDSTASFAGEAAGDHAGLSVAGAGDADHDGYDDLLIGAEGSDEGGGNAGQTYLVMGRPSGWSMGASLSAANASFWGEALGDSSGSDVAGAGDVDGDGCDDILIGSPMADAGADGAGRVHLVLGRTDGWAMDTNLSGADASYRGEAAYDAAGCSVSGAGDVDGDGHDDFLVGACLNDDGGLEGGQTYLMLPGREPPRWVALPGLQAVEDIPMVYDFSAFVSDPDTPQGELSVSSGSPFVTTASGLEATFLFPNNVTRASVPLDLSDGTHLVRALVNITVEPVNDPPGQAIPGNLTATEGVPETVHLATYVWDVDNEPTDLTVSTNSPYATVAGLDLTVTFPRGVLEYDLWLNISDGNASAGAKIHFTVIPVDHPPTIMTARLPPATEDMPYEFTLAASDPDPGEVLAWSMLGAPVWLVLDAAGGGLSGTPGNGDVGGRQFTVGVTDAGGLRDELEFVLTVIGVNDPPQILSSDLTEATEDVAYRVVYRAEDVDVGDILIWSFARNAMWVSFDPTTGVLSGLPTNDDVGAYYVNLTVTDASGAFAFHNFTLRVLNVNDPPTILTMDVRIATEGIAYRVEYSASDPDAGDTQVWALDTDAPWLHIEPATGVVSGLPTRDDVRSYRATVTVTDRSSASDSHEFTLTVVSVNHPPVIMGVSPANGTIFDLGEAITFEATAQDPDGDALNYTWRVGGRELGRGSPFTTSSLDEGRWTVTLVVDDGNATVETQVWITVRRLIIDAWPPTGLCLTLVAITAVLILLWLVARTRRK